MTNASTKETKFVESLIDYILMTLFDAHRRN